VHSEGNRSGSDAGYWIGWCILAAALTQLRGVVAAFVAMQYSRSLGNSLLLLLAPTVLMLILAGVGLIMRKFFGYWCAYLATFFGGFGGLKVSFVPFIQRYVNLGPQTGDFFLALNLIIIGILVWEHFLRLNELEPARRTLHRITMSLVLVAGLGSVAFGRAMEDHNNGTVANPGALPVVGGYFQTLASKGPVRFVSVHAKLLHGIDLVFSGEATEESVRAFAAEHALKPLEKPEAYQKILPRTRRWKLKENEFPTKFAPPDLLFVGRPRSGEQAVMQIAWRKSDSRFTVEMLGTVMETADAVSPQ
jgi:hypothetical protein